MSVVQTFVRINNLSHLYFAYTVPWISVGCSTFAIASLYLRKRTEDNLLIFLFKWRYVISLVYALNMIFLDQRFAIRLFGYNLIGWVSEDICRLRYFTFTYIYCLPSWIQVVGFLSPYLNTVFHLI